MSTTPDSSFIFDKQFCINPLKSVLLSAFVDEELIDSLLDMLKP